MDADESFIYGSRVLELLSAARKKLTAKYSVELETPVFVEIFPRQQDFAIRTFGLPGGDGFLGVCFGRLVTMNSPAAQGANLTSWESVLWHEFCHVVTLQKTRNRMPRWLSEGISVYEERLADPAWGEAINPKYREMLLDENLTPVSQLSGAFLNPPSPLHLQFAYYESSLVVEYLVNEFGIDSLVNVLDELAFGTPINDALRRHVAPVEFLNREFRKFARNRAKQFAKDANWDKPELPATADVEAWQRWNQEHPRNVPGLLELAKQQVKLQEFEQALVTLRKIVELDPAVSKSAYALMARVYRELEEPEKEQQTLESLARLDADTVEPLSRLLELASSAGQWENTKSYARRMVAVNPLIPMPYRYLSIAAEKTNDDVALIESLQVLARMDPLDRADVHFRLASALFREGDVLAAKRHVLMALDQAPRYRDAHQLLLKISGQASDRPQQDLSVPQSEKMAEPGADDAEELK
jgi:tetratricopeptide (TPR) repeat protein